MAYIKVYEYNTIEECQKDIDKIDNFLGLPNSGGNTFDEPIEINGKFYFRADYFTDDVINKIPIEIIFN